MIGAEVTLIVLVVINLWNINPLVCKIGYIFTDISFIEQKLNWAKNNVANETEWKGCKKLTGVGFEPTPHLWLVPKTSALDYSATLSTCSYSEQKID